MKTIKKISLLLLLSISFVGCDKVKDLLTLNIDDVDMTQTTEISVAGSTSAAPARVAAASTAFTKTATVQLSQIEDIKKYVTKVASIFPFEADAYREFNCDVEFVGHPLVDIVKPTMTKETSLEFFGARPEAKKILLMPGSRKQEVLSLLDTMLQAGEQLMEAHEDIQFFLPRAHTIDREELEAFIDAHHVPVTITEEHIYDLMQICDVCLAASGTATLETAMMELPTVLLYQVSPVTYGLGKMLVNLNFVGLPNIIAGKQVIPELLQGDVNITKILAHVEPLLTDAAANEAMRSDLRAVRDALGAPGAVKRVAQVIGSLAEEKIHE